MKQYREQILNILKVRGEHKQILKALEEIAELQSAMLHAMFGTDSVSHVKEEITDVAIMLEYLKIIFNLKDSELLERAEGKLQREMNRINGEVK